MKRKAQLYPYFLLLPTFPLVALVSVYPVVISCIYAFSNMHYLEIRGFIGLGNFAKIIRDPAFWNSR